jgi:hypothetical protein
MSEAAFLLSCLIFVFVFVVPSAFISVTAWREIGRPTCDLLFKEARKKRFGMGTLFSAVAVFSLTFAILRAVSPNERVPLLGAFIAFVLAVGMISLFSIIRADFRELYSSRSKRDAGSHDSPKICEPPDERDLTIEFIETRLVDAATDELRTRHRLS